VEARPREILIFEASGGRAPFSEWMDTLIGDEVYGIILTRLDRVEDGNFGDSGPVGAGVSELRIHFGPGYRVYFGQDGDFVILLGGGKKGTQAADIERAKAHWAEYNA
jgi:putative addiction module killer protein